MRHGAGNFPGKRRLDLRTRLKSGGFPAISWSRSRLEPHYRSAGDTSPESGGFGSRSPGDTFPEVEGHITGVRGTFYRSLRDKIPCKPWIFNGLRAPNLLTSN